MKHRDIIVIGTSTGGIETLKALVVQLPEDLPAALFFVALLLEAGRKSILAEILSRLRALRAKQAEHGEVIRQGCIYVAPSDRHLLLQEYHVQLTRGPRENGFRPAIDPLFRVAATLEPISCKIPLDLRLQKGE